MSTPTHAATLVVNSELDTTTDCIKVCTLRGAVNEANSNGEIDRIYFAANVSHIPITSELLLDNNDSQDEAVDILFRGAVTIDAGQNDRVFSIAKDTHVAMSGIRITGGLIQTHAEKARGGGIANYGSLDLYGVKVYNNRAKATNPDGKGYASGGGIYNGLGASLSLYRSEIGPRNAILATGYDGEADGGGIYNYGLLQIRESIIHHNSVYTQSAAEQSYAKSHGGGLYHTGNVPAYIVDSSIYDNRVDSKLYNQATHSRSQGAGLYVNHWATLYLTNTTVSTNHARSFAYGGPSFAFAYGGGLYVAAHTKIYLANATVADNTVTVPTAGIDATKGVGSGIFAVYTGKSDVRLRNSIVFNPGENCNYPLASDGYNILADSTCKLKAIGDEQNTNPLLGPLQSNGGFGPTQALLPNSPAINTGNLLGCYDFGDKLLTRDQRGFSRPQIGCDRGAYETQD